MQATPAVSVDACTQLALPGSAVEQEGQRGQVFQSIAEWCRLAGKEMLMRRGKRLFPLGQIVATPGAIDTLRRANQSPTDFLNRHVGGDWGELGNEDRTENEYSLEHGLRIFSSYTTGAGEKLWIITEADRSSTTLVRPEEY